MKVYIVYILRYGSEELGRHFFGVFDNPNLAHREAKNYNSLRGEKYPEYEIEEHSLNEVSVFEESRKIVRLTNETNIYQIANLTKIF